MADMHAAAYLPACLHDFQEVLKCLHISSLNFSVLEVLLGSICPLVAVEVLKLRVHIVFHFSFSFLVSSHLVVLSALTFSPESDELEP